MLMDQIINFELRGLGPLVRTCTPTTGYFHVKTKISKENLRILTKFNPKMQNYKRILDQILSKRRIETI